MVVFDIDDEKRTGVIILRPNHSWSWRANVIFLSILMGVSLTIAVGFVFAGAWVILPFSLLEMTFLTFCIYYCVKQCARQEVITISDYEVLIERGINSPSEEQSYQRMWAKFFVESPKRPWDPVTLFIRSHGEEQEIGSFLNSRDKQNLVGLLKRVVPA